MINLIQYSKKAGCRQQFSPRDAQFELALHKNRPLHKVLCSGLWSCFKGQAVVLAPGSGTPLEPDDDLLMYSSYTSLVISQFRE